MKKLQFQNIARAELFEVYVTGGKHKGKVGVAQRDHRESEIHVSFDHKPKPTYDDPRIHYKYLELTDGNGNPCLEPVRDMTGREIEVDTWVVYSVNSNTSHALEIGKVQAVSDIGYLTVRRLLRNGNPVNGEYWSRDTRILQDAYRTLKLPVDATTMTMWVLKDFSDLKYGD